MRQLWAALFTDARQAESFLGMGTAEIWRQAQRRRGEYLGSLFRQRAGRQESSAVVQSKDSQLLTEALSAGFGKTPLAT